MNMNGRWQHVRMGKREERRRVDRIHFHVSDEGSNESEKKTKGRILTFVQGSRVNELY